MSLKFVDHFTREEIRAHPAWLFVFGDNYARAGFGGQPKEARGEPNSAGLATKRAPSWDESAFLTDEDYDEWKLLNRAAFDRIEAHLAAGGVVIWPVGIGLGRANLQSRAPKILQEIHDWLWAWVDKYGRLKA